MPARSEGNKPPDPSFGAFMGEKDDASRFIPAEAGLKEVAEAAKSCTACPLHLTGTQTVFGAGPRRAKVMFVGEQPGDQEDRAGAPFVGPAGKMLDKALDEAGVDRSAAYVTNAVKHFKWVPRGKRRIHSKPSAGEIRACHPWLEEEIRLVAPAVIVCLGATAAQALLGRNFKVTKQRGEFVKSNLAPYVMATVHPSSLLRAPDEAARREEYGRFVEDLRGVAKVLSR
jgi:uracil-DNA glycosylase family protein